MIAIGSGLYIGAGLGTGPRDGIMVGLVGARLLRSASPGPCWKPVVLVAGIILGGTVGIGTVAFMLGIGPLVHVLIPLLDLPPKVALEPVT